MSYNIMPADKYKVVSKTILTDVDKENLFYYYSPITGSLPISLYLLLWDDINKKDDESEYLLHHHLLNILKCTSKSIKEAREALEAVGLLKSYVKEDNVLYYIYEMYSPLMPNEFFNHPILSVVLNNNIGSEEYQRLLKKYQKKKIDYTGFIEITRNMDDVYKVENNFPSVDAKEKDSGSIKLTSKIDYDLISSSIPQNTLSDKAFNKKTKELIDNLSYIYNLDTLKMIEFIRKSLNEFGMIDKTTLRETARKYYELSSGSLPTIVYRSQPEYLKSVTDSNNIRSQIIMMFDNTSPYDFLKNKNKGANPTSKELKLVEHLMNDLELKPAVVNVLLDYVLKINNNKLTNAYVETIAGQWQKVGLKTAKEAMDFAAKEYKKRSTSSKDDKSKKVVETPEWFNKDIKKEEVSAEEEKELENLLKEFK